MARDYDLNAAFGRPRLIDDFHVEHKPTRSFYLNGRGQEQEKVNLAQNEKVWFIIEFENGASDIRTVRIISDNIQLSGTVEQF